MLTPSSPAAEGVAVLKLHGKGAAAAKLEAFIEQRPYAKLRAVPLDIYDALSQVGAFGETATASAPGSAEPLGDRPLPEILAASASWQEQVAKLSQGRPERPLTILGLAESLADIFAGKICHVPELKIWRVWDGRRWADDGADAVFQAVKFLLRSEQERAAASGDIARRRDLLKYEDSARVFRVLDAARSEPRFITYASKFDADPAMLNVENGILDLKKMELMPHDPAGLHTLIAGAPFEPGPCPTFEKFMLDTAANRVELAFYRMARAGHDLTGDTSNQDLRVHVGSGGNGKSVEAALTARVLGSYHKTAKKELFVENGRGSDAGSARPDLLALAGARRISVEETDEGDRLRLGFLKDVTGGGSITARALFSNRIITFEPSFKIVLLTNHKPRLPRVDYAVRRRIRLIPYDWRCPPDQADPAIGEKLAAEAGAILALWAEGAKVFYERGRGPSAFPRCEVVEQASAEYADNEDFIARFLAERCTVAPSLAVKSADLYAAYEQWSEAEGLRPAQGRNFGEALAERGIIKRKSHGLMIFSGVSL